MPQINKHLKNLAPYPPGKPIEEVKREYGLDSVIKLASNENPLGPSPKAVKAMQAAAIEMNLYPDGAAFYLKDAIAQRLGVKTSELFMGNGSDEIMALLAMAYLNPKRELITSTYSFVRYPMVAELAGAQCTLIPMKDMKHDLDAIAAAVTEKTAIICLDIPCNPTGTIVSKRELTKFFEKVPQEVIIVLDQAYFEFAAEDKNYPDGVALRKKHPNLFVTRTFSKSYGLAGLRIGYAVARPEIIHDLERVRPPFNASRIGQAAALAALEDTAHLKKTVANNAKGLKQLEEGFKKLGLKSWPSWANFVLVDIGQNGPAAFVELLKLGVVTRPMAGYGLTNFLRISVGTPAENKRCLAALKQVLKKS